MASLAMDSDAALGVAAGVLDRNSSLRADLMSMWVARRIGAWELAESLGAWARGHNVVHLHPLVTSDSHNAIQFYQSLGFASPVGANLAATIHRCSTTKCADLCPDLRVIVSATAGGACL